MKGVNLGGLVVVSKRDVFLFFYEKRESKLEKEIR
jgi:hypothetical protein